MRNQRGETVFRKGLSGLMVCVFTVTTLGQYAPAYAKIYTADISIEELIGQREPGGVIAAGSGALAQDPDLTAAPAAATMALSVMSSAGSGGEGTLSGPQAAVNSIQVDPSSGTGVLSLPLFSPAARLGMKPNLGLTYSPRSGNGVLGMGWSIGFGSIERSTQEGPPAYDGTDTFIATVDGASSKLVRIAEGRYRFPVEGAFYNFQYDGERWLMRNGKGLTYYFGDDQSYGDRSRLKNSGGDVFQWRLSRVEDSVGNYYLIRYLEDDSFEVYWTGEPGTADDGVNVSSQKFFARVVARMEGVDRKDPVVSYRAGFKQDILRRISSIEIYAGDQLQRSYSFQYGDSERSGRSVLRSIREYGADGQSSMPEVRLEYNEEDLNYQLSGITGDPATGDNLWGFRKNREGYDRGHENYGPVPPWHFAPLTDAFIGRSWTGAGSWTQDGRGRFRLAGIKDQGYYFYTYFYVQKPTTIQAQFAKNQWNPGFWLNGNYSQSVSETQWPLKAGYNLFEYTDYHQHSSFYSELLTEISAQVDLMNSSQVILPQLAGDFNGDGFADVATYFYSTGKVKVALSNGRAFLPKETWLEKASVESMPILGDFNADGRTDIAFFESAGGNWNVYVSSGSGFIEGKQWISGFGPGETPSSGDFNGDGLADIATFFNGLGKKRARIAINRGGRFEPVSAQTEIGSEDVTPFVGDFNGDGLTDLATFRASEGRWMTYSNIGKISPEFRAAAELLNFARGQSMSVADVNGDGLADVGYFNAAEGTAHFRCSRSEGFDDHDHDLPFSFHLQGLDIQLQSSDFNGDGVVDFIVYNQTGNVELAYSSGVAADLLTEIDNGVGGKTRISYAPSTAYSHTYLPFSIPLVSSVEISNSRDYSVRRQYWYEGGLWKPEDREFYGFKTFRIVDPAGRFVETVFSQQDVYLRGRILSSASFQPDGRRIFETLKTWEVKQLFADAKIPVRFPCLTWERNRTYGEDGVAGIELKTWNLYSVDAEHGVAYQNYRWFQGAQDLNGYSSEINNSEYRYYEEPQVVSNFSDDVWLVHFLRSKSQGGSGYYRKNEYFYDGAGSNNAAPTVGLLTQQRMLVPGDSTVQPQVVTYEYDRYGNRISQTDPQGNHAYTQYDGQYHLFAATQTNALGQSSLTRYFGTDGVSLNGQDGSHGLFGQVESVSDLNGAEERYSYDAFGRLLKVVSPDDSLALPTQSYEYRLYSDHMATIYSLRREPGTAQTIDSAQFSDGLGMPLQAKALSGQSGQYVVTGQKSVDALGRVTRVYIPRAVSTTLDVLDEIDDGALHAQLEYDERDRLVRQTGPDGTYRSMGYGVISKRAQATVSAVDANGHKKVSYSDALGRVVKIEEYQGADGRSSPYPQTAYALYSTTEYGYNGEGRLLSVLDDQGNLTSITYDGLGRKVAMDDPDMGHWEYGYDQNGNLAWQIDAEGRRLNFSYDALNRLVNKSDGADIDVVYTYDREDLSYSQGQLGLVEYGPMGDGDWAEFQYDQFGREIRSQKTIDGQPYQVQRMYDSLKNLTGVIYPDGTAVYYHFNAFGQLDGVVNDPELFNSGTGANGDLSSAQGFWGWLGQAFSSIFGVREACAQEAYRAAEIISPLNGAAISALPIVITWDPGVNVSQYYLYIGSSFGGNDVYSAPVSGGRTTISNLNFAGGPMYLRLWSYAGSRGWQYRDYEYQSAPLGNLGVPAELTVPAQGTVIGSSPVQFSWSPGSNVSGYFLFAGTSSGANDLFGKYFPTTVARTVSIPVPVSGNSLYVRLWSFMSTGRWEYRDYTFATQNSQTPVPAQMLTPSSGAVLEGSEAEFRWDVGVGVLQYWVYVGTQQGRYDILNRNLNKQTSMTVSISRTGQPLYVRLWSRTALGWKYYDYQYLTRSPNQKPVISLSGETVVDGQALEIVVIATDADGDVLEFTRPAPGDLPLGCDFSIVGTSNGRIEGRLTWVPAVVQTGVYAVTFEVGDGEEAVSEDVDIEVVSGVRTEEPIVYVAGIHYTVMGQAERIEYGSGEVTTQEYHPQNFRLLRMLTMDAEGAPLQDLAYSYDAVGNIISIQDSVHSSTQSFVYDHLNRLVQARNDRTYGTKVYAYDSVGNIKEKDGLLYRYGEAGSRIDGLPAGPHAVTSLENGKSFQYDANGNMVRREFAGSVSGFEFDAEGRLKRALKNNEQKVRFAYDGDGGRVKKIVYGALSGGGVSGMMFPELLEGNGGEEDLVTHFIGQLYERTTMDQTKHVFLGDKRIASVRNGTVAFIHGDHLGSANVVSDREGRISEVIEYQPFGSFSRHERFGGVENGSAYFTGQRLDDETGLYYYESRYYDPELGRFISADTMVPAAGDPQAFNRYTYVRNNPVILVDPDGHGWFLVALIGALIGGASGGIIAHNNDQSLWRGILLGGVQGFLSGAALGTPFTAIESQGYWWGLTQISGGLSLGSQVAGAAGWSEAQQALTYASMATAGLYLGANVLKGVKDWVYEDRFRLVDGLGSDASVTNGSKVHVNGIVTDFGNAMTESFGDVGADFLAYNPSSGPIADLMEAGLGKLTFTSSMSRQLSNRLVGLNGIRLSGFSQGGIIASNVALNLGLRDQRQVLSSLTVGSTQVSQVRVLFSGATAGLNSKHVLYKTGMWDFSAFLGPHLNPRNFAAGSIGTAVLPLGIENHYWPY